MGERPLWEYRFKSIRKEARQRIRNSGKGIQRRGVSDAPLRRKRVCGLKDQELDAALRKEGQKVIAGYK